MYPYYKLMYELNIEHLKKLTSEFKPKIIMSHFPKALKYEDKYFVIIDKWSENYELNSLTDYFTEKVRVKCSFGSNISPLEYWNKNKNKIIDKLKKQNQELSIFNLREQMFKETKLCNNFRVSVVVTILKYFNTKKYLDISAGWGDRLLGSIIHKVKLYCGVDPNEELHKYYQKMIDKLVSQNNRKRFILLKSGFENAKLPNTTFDLVFSSPPFFDLEKYSTFSDDSLTKYNNEKDWCDKFLMVSIHKAIDYLKKDGHLILYIHSSHYIDKRIREIDNILEYKGLIYFYDTSLRGMHVWKKNF